MDVASYARMPAEDLDDVISQVARPNRVGKTERGGWKFIYEADQSFINKYVHFSPAFDCVLLERVLLFVGTKKQ